MRLLLLILLMTLTLMASDKKVALVIGNSNYTTKSLPNARNDAKDIKDKLEALGYEVVFAPNVNGVAFDNAINAFHNKVIGSDIAVVFYAGHGIQIEGENYMIPLGVNRIYTHRDLSKLVNLSDLIAEAKIAKKFAVLFIDACRDNPLKNHITPTIRSSVTRGLGQVKDTPSNILVSFATKAEQVVSDGYNGNSPYTKALKQLIGKNQDIRFVIGGVKDLVVEETRYSQVPQEPTMFGTLGGSRFCLSGHCPQPIDQSAELRRLQAQLAQFQHQSRTFVYSTPVIETRNHSTKGITTIDGLMYQNQPLSRQDKSNYDKDKNGGRVWDWKGAKNYCQGLTLGGYDDWRLPNKTELMKLGNIKLYNYDNYSNWKKWFEKNKHRRNKSSKGYEYFVQKKFVENMPPLNGNYKYASFWSSTERDSSYAWVVSFSIGYDRWYVKAGQYYALCVR